MFKGVYIRTYVGCAVITLWFMRIRVQVRCLGLGLGLGKSLGALGSRFLNDARRQSVFLVPVVLCSRIGLHCVVQTKLRNESLGRLNVQV